MGVDIIRCPANAVYGCAYNRARALLHPHLGSNAFASCTYGLSIRMSIGDPYGIGVLEAIWHNPADRVLYIAANHLACCLWVCRSVTTPAPASTADARRRALLPRMLVMTGKWLHLHLGVEPSAFDGCHCGHDKHSSRWQYHHAS